MEPPAPADAAASLGSFPGAAAPRDGGWKEMAGMVGCNNCKKRNYMSEMLKCDTCDKVFCKATCSRTVNIPGPHRQLRMACQECADSDSDFNIEDDVCQTNLAASWKHMPGLIASGPALAPAQGKADSAAAELVPVSVPATAFRESGVDMLRQAPPDADAVAAVFGKSSLAAAIVSASARDEGPAPERRREQPAADDPSDSVDLQHMSESGTWSKVCTVRWPRDLNIKQLCQHLDKGLIDGFCSAATDSDGRYLF